MTKKIQRQNYSLSAQVRTLFGKKSKMLRSRGWLPGVVYGPKTDTLSIQIPSRDFSLVYQNAGNTGIIDLQIKNKEGKIIQKDVLIKDVQRHHLDSTPRHVDFYEIEKGKKLTVNVPLNFQGEAPGVKNGGILVKSMEELEIEALPKNIPQFITVDLSSLKDFGQTIYLKDLVLPADIECSVDPNTPIVTLNAPITEEELEEELGAGKNVEEVGVEAEEKKTEEEETEKANEASPNKQASSNSSSGQPAEQPQK